MQTIRVLARGAVMVADHRAFPARRFIGRDPEPLDAGQILWVRRREPTALTLDSDVVRILRDGDLWPADAESARLAGVRFDPKFGGEYAEETAR